MGNCAENTASKHSITREEQDDHCLSSYTRAENAWKNGLFEAEIAPVTVKGRKGDTIVKEDEDYTKLIKEKFRSLKGAFAKENGTVTAANSSSINDGASAVVLASGEVVEKEGLKPIARIIGPPFLITRYWMMLTDSLRRRRLRPHRLPHSADPRCAHRPQTRRAHERRHRTLGIQRGIQRRRRCSGESSWSRQVESQREGRRSRHRACELRTIYKRGADE